MTHIETLVMNEIRKALENLERQGVGYIDCDKYCGFYSGKNKSITRGDILKIAEKLKTYGYARD